MGHSLPLLMSTAEAFCLFFTVLKLLLLLLLNSATQKLLVIKPHFWPWIKILSSRGHKSDAFHHKLCTRKYTCLTVYPLNCSAGDPVQFLGQEDPLEKGMATHSSILAWRIPVERGARQATVHGVVKIQT